jgi:hypothetical protein
MNYSDKRKQEMYDWFHQRFMEPAPSLATGTGVINHALSCCDVYCAGEVVRSNFRGVFPDKVIDEVANDLEAERPKWVLKKVEAPPVSF